MDGPAKHAAAHLEQALTHLEAALIYWQIGSWRKELTDLSERLAIVIDEGGPMPSVA
ncbi:hypothetical protein [Novosphingobium olei]|uniref:hypothetical protein n=1 Tax=Novosphingobium olei TaxID=2728851 RepID=UPI003090A2ED|nr:hypothetical protein NSDW_11430 [Novosphingobium olei]